MGGRRRVLQMLALLIVIAMAIVPPIVFSHTQINQAITWVIEFNSLAIIPGIVLSFVWFWSVCTLAGIDKPFATELDLTFPITGIFIGAVERYFFGIAVALDISGVLTGMIIWTAIKAQSHWQIFSGPRVKNPSIKSVYAGMFGSVFSLLIAVVTGYLCRITK